MPGRSLFSIVVVVSSIQKGSKQIPLQPAMQTTRSPARFQYNPNSGPSGLVSVAAELWLVIPTKPICL